MVIHVNIEMARMLSEAGSPMHVNLDSAMHGVRRATELTRQMLAYAGKGQFKLEPLDLNRLAEETVAFLKASVGRNITLRLERGTGLPPFRADRGQIEQVIMNIVLNGAEAIGEDRGTVMVRTRVLDCTEADFEESRLEVKPAPGRYLTLEVEDDGCGMDEKTLDHLFDPFYSTKFVGRGLGMSAVLGIVRTHKGAILVDTEPGRGSSLRVFFPTLEKTPGEKAGRAGAEPAGESENLMSMAEITPLEGTVLVVDDDIPVQALCTSALKRFGLSVLTASDAEDALDRLNECPDGVDCIIVACGLEGKDGRSAFESLMAAAPGAKGVLAGKAESPERERVSGVHGYSGFLEKPYRLKSLYEAMRRVLGA
jgi:CheY-like chemotaxis protein